MGHVRGEGLHFSGAYDLEPPVPASFPEDAVHLVVGGSHVERVVIVDYAAGLRHAERFREEDGRRLHVPHEDAVREHRPAQRTVVSEDGDHLVGNPVQRDVADEISVRGRILLACEHTSCSGELGDGEREITYPREHVHHGLAPAVLSTHPAPLHQVPGGEHDAGRIPAVGYARFGLHGGHLPPPDQLDIRDAKLPGHSGQVGIDRIDPEDLRICFPDVRGDVREGGIELHGHGTARELPFVGKPGHAREHLGDLLHRREGGFRTARGDSQFQSHREDLLLPARDDGYETESRFAGDPRTQIYQTFGTQFGDYRCGGFRRHAGHCHRMQDSAALRRNRSLLLTPGTPRIGLITWDGSSMSISLRMRMTS